VGFPIEKKQRSAATLVGAKPAATMTTDDSDVVPVDRAATFPVWIAVAGGCGYAPLAPGTAGSLAAAILFGVACYGGTRSGGDEVEELPLVLILAVAGAIILAVCVIGTWASGRAEMFFGRHDDGRIVIDEVAGQWITLVPILFFLPALSPDLFSLFFAVVTGFVVFRVFDIWKPGAIRWTERRFEGGWGVMADDIMAGVHGACLLGLGLWLWSDTAPALALTGALSVTGALALTGALAMNYFEGGWA
jgi:phosphatidylglycerophosphatase A